MSLLSQLVSQQFRRLGSTLLARCQGSRDETGGAMVEMGLMLAILGVPLFLGTSYFGVLLVDQIEVANAAHAGAMYAMTSSTFAEDTSNIIAAAQAETNRFGTSLNVTPSIYYACSNAISGTQYTSQTLANTACTGSTTHTLEFISVTASASVTPPGSVPGYARTVTISSTSVMEVEE
jgi:Flp pilus assembly protein TadG